MLTTSAGSIKTHFEKNALTASFTVHSSTLGSRWSLAAIHTKVRQSFVFIKGSCDPEFSVKVQPSENSFSVIEDRTQIGLRNLF